MNNDHFEIERSINGTSFDKINEVKGSGNSTALVEYTSTDKTAANAFAQTNVLYYRLKQVDFDGKFTYSKISSVVNEDVKEFNILSVQPNPFNEGFILNYSSSIISLVNIQIIDVLGKTIYSSNSLSSKGINSLSMPSDNDLRSGVYFVRLTQNDETRLVKIVKQN